MRPDGPRDPLAGPDSGPESPFPIRLSGPVIKGFGRGSKELGIPTANIPPEGLSQYPDIDTGVYYGFVGLSSAASSSSSPNTTDTSGTSNTLSTTPTETKTYPAVLSIGYNPFYKNTVRSVEIHILHHFPRDFYGASLNLLMLGFIRPEYDYVSKESLIDDIKTDCDVARDSLQRDTYARYMNEKWLMDFAWAQAVDVTQVEKEVLAQA